MRRAHHFAIIIVGTSLLAGCGKSGDNPPPQATDRSPAPTQKSLIAVPIESNTAALQSALHRALPRTLWTINQREAECIAPQHVRVFGKDVRVSPPISCAIIGDVTRGSIKLRGEGDEIIADVPIHAHISATDVGGVLKGETATGSAMVQARVKINIAENWQTSGTARLTYGWTDEPGIDFLGRRITFADQADAKLQPMLKDIEREVAAEIAKLDVKSQAENIWRESFTSLELNSENPPVWLRLTPQRIYYGGYQISGQIVRLNFALEAITESFVSARPADPKPIPLPNLIAQEMTPYLDVNIPVLATYQQLAPVILRALIKRSKRPIHIPGIGAVNSKFDKITIYGAPQGKIAVGLALDVTPEDGETSSGKIWLTATPVNQAGSAELGFTDLSVTGSTGGRSGDLLIRLGNSPGFAQLIAAALSQNFTDDLAKLEGKIKLAVDMQRTGDFVLRAKVQDFQIGQVRAYGNGVYLPVRMVGTASVNYSPAN